MSQPAIRQLEILQRSLYEKAFKEAQSLVVGVSKTFLAYSAEFEKSLPRRITQTNKTELMNSFKTSNFVLYGDFHTLRQSQRGFLRLLRSYCENQKSKKIILALEMFKASDQYLIDEYMSDKIDENDFLSLINYNSEWGFPWQNFRMILDYARIKSIRVIGINTRKAGRDSLAERDAFAAEKLLDNFIEYPDHKILCLIGEYHLADRHLPAALRDNLKKRKINATILRILNNIDEYYFKLKHEDLRQASTEILKLRKDTFCIMNSPPWIKWKSFSLWEEMQTAALHSEKDIFFQNYQDLEISSDDHFDIDFQFLNFVRIISEFIGVSIDSSDLETFHIHYSSNGDFYDILIRDGQLNREIADRIVERASFDGVYFIPKLKKILITYISINNLAEASGQFLHSYLSKMDGDNGTAPADFYRRIIKSAAGMVGSKILNPRRKCWELVDIARFVKRHRGQRLEGAAEEKRLVAKAIVAFHNWISRRMKKNRSGIYVKPLDGFLEIDEETNYSFSRSLGQIAGINIYRQVITNNEPPRRIRSLFKTKQTNEIQCWNIISDLFRDIP